MIKLVAVICLWLYGTLQFCVVGEGGDDKGRLYRVNTTLSLSKSVACSFIGKISQ